MLKANDYYLLSRKTNPDGRNNKFLMGGINLKRILITLLTSLMTVGFRLEGVRYYTVPSRLQMLLKCKRGLCMESWDRR